MKNRITKYDLNGVYTCTFRVTPKGDVMILSVPYKPFNWNRPERYSRGLVMKMFKEAVEAGISFYDKLGYLPGRIESEGREVDGLVESRAFK